MPLYSQSDVHNPAQDFPPTYRSPLRIPMDSGLTSFSSHKHATYHGEAYDEERYKYPGGGLRRTERWNYEYHNYRHNSDYYWSRQGTRLWEENAVDVELDPYHDHYRHE